MPWPASVLSFLVALADEIQGQFNPRGRRLAGVAKGLLMRSQVIAVGTGSLALAGCATGNVFDDGRSVFNNPYDVIAVDYGTVGPKCNEPATRRDGCYLDSLIYPGRGKYALDRDGNRVRLTRRERSFIRERNEAIQGRIDVLNSLENGTPIPPNSPALRDIPPPPSPVPEVGDTMPAKPIGSR